MNKEIKLIFIVYILVTLIGLTISYTYAASIASKNISTNGTIKLSSNLGVYSDSACQKSLSTINWGDISPGSTITRTVFIKNTSNGASLSLSLSTSYWNPTSAKGPITITWNQEDVKLLPGQTKAATITLSVSPSVTDISSFSFQINVTGEY